MKPPDVLRRAALQLDPNNAAYLDRWADLLQTQQYDTGGKLPSQSVRPEDSPDSDHASVTWATLSTKADCAQGCRRMVGEIRGGVVASSVPAT